MKTCVEYIWIDNNGDYRSKCKVIHENITSLCQIPNWNFDGSSTQQNNGNNTEVLLIPVALFRDPLRTKKDKLVLCECFDPISMTPIDGNNRHKAYHIFQQKTKSEPWFGIEQEYFIYDNDTFEPVGMRNVLCQGSHYCGVGSHNIHKLTRIITETHLKLCLQTGINISGANIEVAPGQSEFQVGPCVGIDAGDHLHIARYLLHRIGEMYNVEIVFHPKPLKDSTWNGSGCHTNFSTKQMRHGTKKHSGYYFIEKAIKKLGKKHNEHMKHYGKDNKQRMSGHCETSSYDNFNSSVGERDVSVRIGNETFSNQQGYFEDRRPSSNCDPYLVTSLIFETCCL
jgi:glutamine synthetase